MGLLDGQIAAAFAAVFAPMYLDAVLHRRLEPEYDDGGSIINAGWADEDVKAQLDSTTEGMRLAGYTDRDQVIYVLAAGVAIISTGDEITVQGQRWAIAAVTQDPAGAYFQLRGQRA